MTIIIKPNFHQKMQSFVNPEIGHSRPMILRNENDARQDENKMASTGAKCSRRHRFVQFLSDILAENNFLDHI